ncbi:MAG: septal ring lytic transglycosylase RlpA family protein [Actinomycetia bacterium]|nr:septal ring lytic transglycosylase RlpA family protein [Actinomycetes bacterium]
MKRKICLSRILLAVPVIAVMTLLITFSSAVFAQYVPDSALPKQEQARSIERDIALLEQKLTKANYDKVVMSRRLEEVEKQILDCYMVIDATEAELARLRKNLNSELRYLYIDGRRDTIVHLINSSDVTDFMIHFDHMVDVASSEAEVLEKIKAKKKRIKQYQDNLIDYKSEAAAVLRNSETEQLEFQVAQKKKELADVTSSIIAMQLPTTQAPAPAAFSPSAVYSEPDDSGFVMTGQVFSGYSSWYGNQFHGRTTASGEVFDQYAFTCAHKQLPFGTWLRVTFRDRTVIVKVNDRGPFIKGRMLDLSRGAAEAIGLSGVQWVDCEIVVPK